MASDAERTRQSGPLRLLWLIDSLTMGGAESLAVEFAREARRRGIDLSVCARTTIDGNPLESEVRAAGADVISVDARGLIDGSRYRHLIRRLEQDPPHVIHSHLTYASIWGALIARRLKIPLVATLHVPPQRSNWKDRMRLSVLVALLNRFASRVVMVSEALRSQWLRETRIDSGKTTVIPNGVHLGAGSRSEASRSAFRAEMKMPSTAFVIATVAVLREGKGIDVLLRAAPEIFRSHPLAYMVIIGDGPMGTEWQQMAAAEGIGDRVRWLGFRRDVSKILPLCDLFVLPTLRDAFPTVIMEAMAARLPVIASEVGGVPEIISGPRLGVLVPAGDPDALAAAIDHATRDDQWREQVAEEARIHVERTLSIAHWADRLEQLYRGLLEDGSRAAG